MVAGHEGLVEFSTRIVTTPTITNWTAGTDLNTNSAYNVGNVGFPRGSAEVQGYTVLFWENGAELHRTEPNNAGDALSGETRVEGFNFSGRGIDDPRKVVSTPRNVYFVNQDGVWEMNPYNGSAINLLEEAGAAQRYFDTFDITDAKISYVAGREFIVVHTREIGEATNNILMCFDVSKKIRPVYIKTRVIGSSLGIKDNELYCGGTSGKIFQIFDETTYLDGFDAPTKARIITEWNAITNAHSFKSFNRASVFASLSPNSSMNFTVYQDGFIDTESQSESYSTEDASNTSSVIGQMGQYIMGLASPDTTNNTDIVKRTRFLSRFITYCFEIEEESDEAFEINSFTLNYKTRGTDVFDSVLANQLFTISA